MIERWICSRCFTAHPATVGENYGTHLGRASVFGLRMMLAGAACVVHGLLPFLFVRTGSRTISELNAQLTCAPRCARPC